MITNADVCPLAACKKSGNCIRYANFLKAKANEDSYSVLNTDRITHDEQGCNHRLVSKIIQHAYGFTKLYNALSIGNRRYFSTYGIFGSESSYYRAKRGDKALMPSEQQKLLERFGRLGVDTSIGFDRYCDVTIYVKP